MIDETEKRILDRIDAQTGADHCICRGYRCTHPEPGLKKYGQPERQRVPEITRLQ